jgi:hypothetical protein
MESHSAATAKRPLQSADLLGGCTLYLGFIAKSGVKALSQIMGVLLPMGVHEVQDRQFDDGIFVAHYNYTAIFIGNIRAPERFLWHSDSLKGVSTERDCWSWQAYW